MWMRTDLAAEARELNGSLKGVTEKKEKKDGVDITHIAIETEPASIRLDKPVGDYISIEADKIADRDPDVFERVADAVADALDELIKKLPKADTVLVVGLGNRFVTPDALGPRTVEKLCVTRHIREKANDLAPTGMRSVAAIAPGVLGITGLETIDVVQGLVEQIKPDCIICIDALASRKASRISTVVQLNNSGILPGAGVNNRQQGLNEATLGVPVIAVGVPTVVYASTIVMETLAAINNKTEADRSADALFSLVDGTMREQFGTMIVTPKDIDQMIDDAADMLAKGMNRMLHRGYLSEIMTLLS